MREFAISSRPASLSDGDVAAAITIAAGCCAHLVPVGSFCAWAEGWRSGQDRSAKTAVRLFVTLLDREPEGVAEFVAAVYHVLDEQGSVFEYRREQLLAAVHDVCARGSIRRGAARVAAALTSARHAAEMAACHAGPHATEQAGELLPDVLAWAWVAQQLADA